MYPGKLGQIACHVVLLVVAGVAQGTDFVPRVLLGNIGPEIDQQFDHLQVAVAGRVVHAAGVHVEAQFGHQPDRVAVVRPYGVLHERAAAFSQLLNQ